jgi:hypothetical protein
MLLLESILAVARYWEIVPDAGVVTVTKDQGATEWPMRVVCFNASAVAVLRIVKDGAVRDRVVPRKC